MKRFFALSAFVVLICFFILSKLSLTALLWFLGAFGIALVFTLLIKKLRKNLILVCILLSVVIFSGRFVVGELEYLRAFDKNNTVSEITGIVCQSPSFSDFAGTYIIKVDGEDYKIRYISQTDKGFRQGDKVCGKVLFEAGTEEVELFESSLASKVYFNCFETEEYSLISTGEGSLFYSALGSIKEWFVDTVSLYLPSDNGSIAIAMSIGDRSMLSDSLINTFNYSGTSHLLVVSGLHLSLWSVSIIRLLDKKRSFRKHTVPIGLCSLFFYSALTGFSIPVLRAGIMVLFTLLGRIFKRASDPINSIGLAVVVIMLLNPFTAYSVSFWFTLLSTLGILVYSNRLTDWIGSFKAFKGIKKSKAFEFVVPTFSVSASTSIFTMPIFIFRFGIMPIASFISNLLMVSAALFGMVGAVFGSLLHLFGITPFAEFTFSLVGTIMHYLEFIAQTVGLWEWSTISVTNPLYKLFAIGLIITAAIVFLAYRKSINLIKPAGALVAIIFTLTSLYCVAFEHNVPTVEVSSFDGNVICLVTYQGKNIVLGTGKSDQTDLTVEKLQHHNEKQIDTLIVTDRNNYTVSRMTKLLKSINVKNTIFPDEISEPLFIDKLTVDISNSEHYCTINYENANLLIINSPYCENLFKSEKKYDIIILSSEALENYSYLSPLLSEDNSQILTLEDKENLSLKLEREKIYAIYN